VWLNREMNQKYVSGQIRLRQMSIVPLFLTTQCWYCHNCSYLHQLQPHVLAQIITTQERAEIVPSGCIPATSILHDIVNRVFNDRETIAVHKIVSKLRTIEYKFLKAWKGEDSKIRTTRMNQVSPKN